jgi:two-component system, NtrC family, nitrogen regulation response regulator GlnG
VSAASHKVLIADDDTSIRLVLSQAFTRAGFQVRATGSAATLLKWVSDGEGDLVITDVVMPDENAFDVLPRLRKMRPQLPAIVMSAQNTLLTAVNAAQIGAFDYVPKPFDLDEMVGVARRALARPADSARARAQARALRDEGLPLIGRSAPMQEVYRTLARLVDTSLNVLITGEVGAGKGLAARALHDLGGKRDAPFVPVQLGGLSAEQVERELFGSGGERPGRLVEADGGALFLDEVGDLSLDAQARLVRVVDAAERPLHPVTGRRLEMRILSSSRHDLSELARQGRFREDLLLRLNVTTIRLPALRERLDDLGDLARAFLFRAHRDGASVKTLDESALQRMQRHSWPGNVRELENLMRRVATLYTEDLITDRLIERELHEEPAVILTHEPAQTVEDLVEQTLAGQFSGADLPSPGLYDRTLESLERPLIRMTLRATRGNQIKAAEVLGINRNTLRKKIEVLGIDVSRRRS